MRTPSAPGLFAYLLLAACHGPAVPAVPVHAGDASSAAPVAIPAASAEGVAAGEAPEGSPLRPHELIHLDPGREIPFLEQRLAATGKGSPERPRLLFRLAEAYAAVEAAAMHDGPKGEATARAARRRAIEHYAALAADHPSFCASAA
jgi:hypothetical protein